MNLLRIVAALGACPTHGEIRRLIRGGGVKVNGEPRYDLEDYLWHGQFAIRVGKSKNYLVTMERGEMTDWQQVIMPVCGDGE